MKNIAAAFSMTALAGLLFAGTAFADDVKAFVFFGKKPLVDISGWHSACLADKQQVVYAATSGIGLADGSRVTEEQLNALQNAFRETVDNKLIEPVNRVAATLVFAHPPEKNRALTAEEQSLHETFDETVKNFETQAKSILGANMLDMVKRLEFYYTGKNTGACP